MELFEKDELLSSATGIFAHGGRKLIIPHP
jgi:hypothetical protein